jgi:Fur family transcriptional regulator, stress-responsive regulator
LRRIGVRRSLILRNSDLEFDSAEIRLGLVLDLIQISIKSSLMTDPADLLREHGVPITAQRLAVLQVVSNRPHATADAITEDVRARIGAISRQAVYDALGLLSKKGLIRKIEPAGSPALFEDRVGDNHHHVICRSCGKTADVDCAVGETPCLTAHSDSGFRIDEAEVIYWGTCPECFAAAAVAENKSNKQSS